MSEQVDFVWKHCDCCIGDSSPETFLTPNDFLKHLRDKHCSKEGGSYVCKYGPNDICLSLPLEGVCDKDYEKHVFRDHCALQLESETGLVSRLNESDTPKWTVYSSKVNLAAALNDPRLGRRNNDIFTKTWGESFEECEVLPCSFLPEITHVHFQRYIKHVFRKYKKIYGQKRRHKKSRSHGKTSQTTEFDVDQRCLSRIPKIYFEQRFILESPETFVEVFGSVFVRNEAQLKRSSGAEGESLNPFGSSESVEQCGAEKTASGGGSNPFDEEAADGGGDAQRAPGAVGPVDRLAAQQLHQQLTDHLDHVELALSQQISRKAGTFFGAMSSQGALQQKLHDVRLSIGQLRQQLGGVDQVFALSSLRVLRLAVARSNLQHLYARLQLMQTIKQIQPNLQLYLATSDFVGAIDLITATQDTLAHDLHGIIGFRHLSSQLTEMYRVISHMMDSDMQQFVSRDLNRPLSDNSDQLDQERLLTAIVLGFLRQSRFDFVDIYRQEALTALKCAIKHTVVAIVAAQDSASSHDTQNRKILLKLSKLAEQVRHLRFDSWLSMIGDVFGSALCILRRVQAFHGVVLQLAEASAGLPPTRPDHAGAPGATQLALSAASDSDSLRLLDDGQFVRLRALLNDTMFALHDAAHERCGKLLFAKAKDGFFERIAAADFLQLNRSVENFIDSCYHLCGRRSKTLKLALQAQANKFVSRFHDERMEKIHLLLENERWKQADIPVDFQELISSIEHTGRMCSLERRSKLLDSKTAPYVNFAGEHFAVVGTVVILIRTVVEYCRCADEIPTLAPDLLSKTVDLLKLFNSQTCRLILGAGALQQVGLKRISSKNLALASRCLQLVHKVLPTVQRHFESLLSPNSSGCERAPAAGDGGGDAASGSAAAPQRQSVVHTNALRQFEQLYQEYAQHTNELSAKLLTVVDSVLGSTIRTKWAVRAPVPSECFRSVVHHMQRVHEAVSDVLPAQQLARLFREVHVGLMGHVRLSLASQNIRNDGAPQHGLVLGELAYYADQLRQLHLQPPIDVALADLWTDLPNPPPPALPPPTTPLPSSTIPQPDLRIPPLLPPS